MLTVFSLLAIDPNLRLGVSEKRALNPDET